MRHLIQPNSRTCGQTCVAMAAGIDIEAAIKLFGHKHGTSTRSMVRVLRHLGFKPAPCLQRITPDRPAPLRSICKMRFRRRDGRGWKSGWHWVLLWDGYLYDPLGPDYQHKGQFQLSSFLDLTCRTIKHELEHDKPVESIIRNPLDWNIPRRNEMVEDR